MIIAHIGKYFPPIYGGMETAVQDFAQLAANRGDEVHVYVAHPEDFSDLPQKENGVVIRRFRQWAKIFSAPICFGYFRCNPKKYDAVVIHLPNPMAELALIWHLLFRKRKNVYAYIHAFPTRQGIAGKLWFAFITKFLLGKTSRILISNQKFYDTLPLHRNFRKKIEILPFAKEVIEEDDLKILAENRKESKSVIAIGRLVGYKGLEELLWAWHLSVGQTKALQGFTLTILGDGPDYKHLLATIEQLRIGNSVRIISGVDEIEKEEYLEEACLFVSAPQTNAESFGIAIQEAMAYGLPVLTTNLSTGVSVLARDGDCGFCAEIRSVDSLRLGLLALLSDPEKREEAGKANHAFIKENFSWQRVESIYNDIFQDTSAGNLAYASSSPSYASQTEFTRMESDSPESLLAFEKPEPDNENQETQENFEDHENYEEQQESQVTSPASTFHDEVMRGTDEAMDEAMSEELDATLESDSEDYSADFTDAQTDASIEENKNEQEDELASAETDNKHDAA